MEMSWYKEWKPKILCLGAGGMKGLDELGAIWWFFSENILSDVDSYIGCSIGGIICALLSIGYWPHEILTFAIDTSLFKNVSEIQMTGVAREYGLVSNTTFDDALAKKLKHMIVSKLGKVPTLSEHYKMTGKKLHLAIASLKGRNVKYASCDTEPDLDLFVGLRSTSNVPGLFGKLEHQKDYFVDGAVMDPLPALHLDDGKTPMLVIGVMDECPWIFEKVGAMSYFDRILAMSLKRLTEYTLANCSKACYCLIIPVTDEVGLVESSSREARIAKFLSGYNFTSRYVQTHPHLTPPVLTQSLPPLSKEMIKACLQSNVGKTLIRCLIEDPELFKECAGLHHVERKSDKKEKDSDFQNVTKKEKDSDFQNVTKKEKEREAQNGGEQKNTKIETPRSSNFNNQFDIRSAQVVKRRESQNEDIVEIPRNPQIVDDDDIIEIPRQEPRPFPFLRQPRTNDFQIVIHIPPEVGNLLFGMFVMGMKAIDSGQGKRFQLP